MKTTSITVEKNFHCMNDDRFLMEKISMTAELHENDEVQTCTNRLREEITENFKAAYPTVEEHLNFHVVRQESILDEKRRNYPLHDERFNNSPIYDTPTEPIDKGFNLIDEINKCKKLVFLKIWESQCKTKEEKAAYANRFIEIKRMEKLQTTKQ